jgi:16S rRNA processing protein RimM
MLRPLASIARSSSRSSKTSKRTKHLTSRGAADPAGSAAIPLGKLVAGHGVRGLGRIKPFHAGSPTLSNASHLWLHHSDGRRTRFAVLGVKPHKQVLLVQLEGIDSLTALEAWIGSVVEIERDQLPAVADDEFYAFEAIGLHVFTVDGERIGEIRETLDLPANDVWVVERPDGREVLIPVIEDVIREVDLVERRATIAPLRGLLDD